MAPADRSGPDVDPGPPLLRLRTGSVVRAVLVVGAALLAVTVARRAASTLAWFAEAAVIAALAYPLVQRLGRRMPRFVAVLVLTGVVAAVVAGLAALALAEVRGETAQLRADVPTAVRDLEGAEGIGPVIRDLRLADQLERVADDVARRFELQGRDLPGLATEVGGRASVVFVVWILTVMLVFTGPGFVDGGLSLLAPERRDPARWVLTRAYRRSVGYLGAMVLRSLVVGVLAFTAAEALGLDMPGILALVAALAAYVPVVGIIGATLPLAVLAVAGGTGRAGAVLAAGIVVAVLDTRFVQRPIEARTVAVGVFPTLVAALLGFSLRGPGGLVVAVAVVTLLMAVVGDSGALHDARAGGGGADPAAPASGSAQGQELVEADAHGPLAGGGQR